MGCIAALENYRVIDTHYAVQSLNICSIGVCRTVALGLLQSLARLLDSTGVFSFAKTQRFQRFQCDTAAPPRLAIQNHLVIFADTGFGNSVSYLNVLDIDGTL